MPQGSSPNTAMSKRSRAAALQQIVDETRAGHAVADDDEPLFTHRFSIRTRAHLEFRHAADGIERVVRQAIRRRLAGPVKRHEDRVRTDVGRDSRREDAPSRAACEGRPARRRSGRGASPAADGSRRSVRRRVQQLRRRGASAFPTDSARARGRSSDSRGKLSSGTSAGPSCSTVMKPRASGGRGKRLRETAAGFPDGRSAGTARTPRLRDRSGRR